MVNPSRKDKHIRRLAPPLLANNHYHPVVPASPPPSQFPPAERSNPERYVIPNLRKACLVLKLLARHPDGMKVADLSRQLDIPVTTTLRIMTTLLLEGFVRKTEGRFELGPVLIQLGSASLAGTEIRELALPVLQRLTAATDETSHLAIPCDDRALIVAVQDSPHPLRAASRPGFLAELHCSSTGKVFLSHLYHGRLDEILSKSPPSPRTPRTLTNAAGLRREIELTRQRGYSLDNEEFHEGVRCLAAPVFAPDGSVVAALGITASTFRFSEKRIPEMAAAVRSHAAELTQLIGGHAQSP
jgi:DNA-binding IclR family transcriptional regulator